MPACALLCLVSACGQGSARTLAQSGTRSGASPSAGSGAGQGAQPTPTKASLIHALDVEGQLTFLMVAGLPAAASCDARATVHLLGGSTQVVTAGGLRASSSGVVTWDIEGRLPEDPVRTDWEVSCTAPDASQPDGVWRGAGRRTIVAASAPPDSPGPSGAPQQSTPSPSAT